MRRSFIALGVAAFDLDQNAKYFCNRILNIDRNPPGNYLNHTRYIHNRFLSVIFITDFLRLPSATAF